MKTITYDETIKPCPFCAEPAPIDLDKLAEEIKDKIGLSPTGKKKVVKILKSAFRKARGE